MDIIPNLDVAYITYVVGTASPGPANLTIMATALQHGRLAGLVTALGVITGSVMWGLVSAFGLGAALLAWPVLLNSLSLVGGLYLCWLGWRALRAARSNTSLKLTAAVRATSKERLGYYLYGLGLHLTNPKAMFVWMSVIALGLPTDNRERLLPFLIVGGCAAMGIIIFGAYAVVFSNPTAIKAYSRSSRAINLLIAAIFCAAGLSLLYRSVAQLFAFSAT